MVFPRRSGVSVRLRAGTAKGPRHMEPVLCSIADAARLLGIGKTKTYELIDARQLDTVAIGVRRMVTVESIKRLAKGAGLDEAA